MLKKLSLDQNAPWKQRFRAPAILMCQLAKAVPTQGLVSSNQSGVYQLYAWQRESGQLRQLTNRTGGVPSGVIAPDGRYVYYHDDYKGNEKGHYVRVPFEGGPALSMTPEMPPYLTHHLAFSQDGKRLGFTAVNSDGYHLYVIELHADGSFSTPRRLHHSDKRISKLCFSVDGQMIVIISAAGRNRYDLNAFDVKQGTQIGTLAFGVSPSKNEMVAFSPCAGDLRLLTTSQRDGLKRPLIWHPRTGEQSTLVLDELEGDVFALDWSPDGQRVLLCQVHRAVQQLYLYDIPHKLAQPLHHANGTLSYSVSRFGGFSAFFASNDEIFTLWHNSTHPPRLIALDSKTGSQRGTVLAAGDVPPSHPWRSVTFPSKDGTPIQGWLALPDSDGPFPTILHLRGGPHLVTTENFFPASQAWLDHGFAFLTINYRGSTTFGEHFEKQIRGQPGYWEVQDIVAAHEWLIKQKIANSKQIILTGWSYGGYLALLALGQHPYLWAGGIAAAAIADWTAIYEGGPKALRGPITRFFDGTLEEKAEQYAISSPITYAKDVQAPLLIIQGKHDPRGPAAQMQAYERRMKALGKEINVLWLDTGHAGPRIQAERYIEYQEHMLRFAYRILSGQITNKPTSSLM